ncbi:MAG TPA: alpha/beta hydrolase [Myxococcota bacterium]|jgi:pimeloyl-ACP methyl ester carboxylesterase|nr:alpha/beta hydrolase [Myxococcota bacterium]
MRSLEEIRGWKDLFFGALSGGVATLEEMHTSIARLPFSLLERAPVTGTPAAVVRFVHDGITGGVYFALRGLAEGARTAAEAALVPLASAAPDDAPPARPALELAVSALNGFVGDRLEESRNGLRFRMGFRHAGRPLALEAEALRRAFPEAANARGRLAVFVHGLAGNDGVWRFYAEANWGDPETTYGSLLARDLGYVPLYLRYNSGLHVSENGRLLAETMEELVRVWPGGVEEIVLVAHSMGGLVTRSACHQGKTSGQAWVDAVRHVFCLGTPHLGAPLEKLGNVAGYVLGSFELTRPLARIVNGRSVGIKDLRYGYLVEEDWRDRDLDALLEDNRHDIPFLDSATHYFIAATITRSHDHPLGVLLGDTLVRLPSASGRGAPLARRVPFRDEHGLHLGAMSHLELLNHPAVYAQIRCWLEAAGMPGG